MEFGVNTKYGLGLPWATQIGLEREEKKPTRWPPSVWPRSKIQCFFGWNLPKTTIKNISSEAVVKTWDACSCIAPHAPCCCTRILFWKPSFWKEWPGGDGLFYTQTMRARELKFWNSMHPPPWVTCQMLHFQSIGPLGQCFHRVAMCVCLSDVPFSSNLFQGLFFPHFPKSDFQSF